MIQSKKCLGFGFFAAFIFTGIIWADRVADKSRFVPPAVGTPQEVANALEKRITKAERDAYLSLLDSYKSSGSSPRVRYGWVTSSSEISQVRMHAVSVAGTEATNFSIREERFKPQSYFIFGQSFGHNSKLYSVYLQYSACVSAAASKNDIAYCAERHAILDLKSDQLCPDRSDAWIAKQETVRQGLIQNVTATPAAELNFWLLPRTTQEFYSNYNLSYSVFPDGGMTYTNNLYDYQTYIAEPYACHVAMKTWALVGTQNGSTNKAYDFGGPVIESIIETINNAHRQF